MKKEYVPINTEIVDNRSDEYRLLYEEFHEQEPHHLSWIASNYESIPNGCTMSALGILLMVSEKCFGFWSTEHPPQRDPKTGLMKSHCTKASKSEIRRWLENKAVLINEVPARPEDEFSLPIKSLILFPKGHRISL